MRQERVQVIIPILTCEAPGCTTQFPLDKAYGIKQIIACAAQSIAAVDCQAEMHYGCSLAHAKAAADQCYTEHLLPAYQQAVQGAARSDSSQVVSGSASPQ